MMDVMGNWKAVGEQMVGTSGVSGFGMNPQQVATDMSPQMGGYAPSGGANASAPPEVKTVLSDAVMLVAFCLFLLWFLGALVFAGGRS